MTSHENLLAVAAEAASLAGRILLSRWRDRPALQVDHKAEFDFVTEVDRQSEQVIVTHLRRHFPQHKILAEEGGLSEGAGEVEWIIDPLDGTTNFIHGVPCFAVSIAARRQGVIIAGVVYDPLRQEQFSAVRGGGAFRNGERLRVSASHRLSECLIATGFPFRAKHLAGSYLRLFRNFFEQVRDMRRMGAASLDLALVAAGVFDGFWEYNLNPWDFAAGSLLVEEAGGRISGFTTGENFWESGNIVASNGRVHALMQELIAEHTDS
ncbi:MAG: inositol monophosphatase [candidate division KSB1 bacterium]|nr:inositol monophosphatase [candidate division KSB1 bacterium]MDZ7275696.1 inositol monophosphatase [candidate division KSB1 bacterium]MDZ7284613.1 inositol monophosphatase [candidate division KSB1 bacterium]MDZ7297968.1 inositol monophosphatase [candidate division KSB1 bacterium]MDZ7305864.1 inositol monophosphatase [candidate division KSB1 bacterium]